MSKIAIIGSRGITAAEFFKEAQHINVETEAGTVPIIIGNFAQHEIFFLNRSHGKPGVPPHGVNYKGNILALMKLGIQDLITTAVVGSLSNDIPVGALLILNQFLDFTKQRDFTLFGRSGFSFVDVTDPYCPNLRSNLYNAAQEVAVPIIPTGCYVGVEGPRYETRAETEMYRRLGGDVIGMTNIPEVVMAREAEICYATLASVSNLGAGLNSGPILIEAIAEEAQRKVPDILSIFRRTLEIFSPADNCPCRSKRSFFSSE
jgi:5'-methylthioadenosine phosphorylase